MCGRTVAAIGGEGFSKGRDFAAWLGLVPKQISTGDRTILGSISKRGNRYLRVLFVQAAKITEISDKYFCLMTINIFENWLKLETPRKKLEYLVIDFRESEMLFIGDRMLPSRVAGIAEIHDTGVGLSLTGV
jgi:hypothetical protein